MQAQALNRLAPHALDDDALSAATGGFGFGFGRRFDVDIDITIINVRGNGNVVAGRDVSLRGRRR